MKAEQAKTVLTRMIEQAVAADKRGDVTMRNQKLRNIEDLPLPVAYVRAALKKHGLLSIYKGA